MIYFGKHFGYYIGQLGENSSHKHYFHQISFAFDGDILLSCGNQKIESQNAVFIPSQTPHQILTHTPQIILLINPLSPIGHTITAKFSTDPEQFVNSLLHKQLTHEFCLAYQNKNFDLLPEQLEAIFQEYFCTCTEDEIHLDDWRIIKALEYLEAHSQERLSLEELAEVMHLSPSRFLHLFSEKTKLNFRGYQVFARLTRSLSVLGKKNITQTAHEFGFTDSAHYAKSIKATFGLSAKFFTKK